MAIVVSACSGCSFLIERSAPYNEFKLNGPYTRDEVVERLGPPLRSEVVPLPPHSVQQASTLTVDTYVVTGRAFDCGKYWATAAGWLMTLGLHELVFFPMSSWHAISQWLRPTQRELKIYYSRGTYECQYTEP
jgi:hypothetical protein